MANHQAKDPEMSDAILAGHDARIELLEQQYAEFRTDVKTIREIVQRIEVKNAEASGRPICAAPSLCLALQPRISELEKSVRELESERDKAAGGMHVARFVLVLLGGATGSVLTFVVQYAIKHL